MAVYVMHGAGDPGDLRARSDKARSEGICGLSMIFQRENGRRSSGLKETRISIFIDNAVIDAFRERAEAAGTCYQTMMNEALKAYLAKGEQPVTESRLREILQEVLPPAASDPTGSSTRTARKQAAGLESLTNNVAACFYRGLSVAAHQRVPCLACRAPKSFMLMDRQRISLKNPETSDGELPLIQLINRKYFGTVASELTRA